MAENTVRKMVDVLFEELLMTDEVRAMRDEVMNNCLERYNSMVNDGYSEEKAENAVMESLKGMDDVLRDYPRLTPITDSDAFSKESRQYGDLDLSGVRALRIQVQSADVEVLPTEGAFDMSLHDGTRTVLVPAREGDTLVITQESKSEHGAEPVAAGSGFFSRLGRAISRSIGTVGDTDARATLRIPAGLLDSAEIHSLSGDITMNVPCRSISLSSASGDCRANLAGKAYFYVQVGGKHWSNTPETVCCEKLMAKSISGDVDITGSFGEAVVSSTSGDADFRGSARSLEITTVSGDVDADVEGDRLKGSTVSGDLDVFLHCGDAAEAEMSTVSGDLTLRLPDHVKTISAKTSTRSGDVSFNGIGLSDGAAVRVSAKSVSGDIEII